MDFLLNLPAAALLAITALAVLMLVLVVAWVALFVDSDRDEVEHLGAALRQADQLLAQAESREVAQLYELKRLRDALRIHEAA